MRIAIPLIEGRLSHHFGESEMFVIHNVDVADQVTRRKEYLVPPPHAPGALPAWLGEQRIDVLIARGIGGRAQQLLSSRGIKLVVCAACEDPDEIVRTYIAGTLEVGANECEHEHGCRH